MNRQALKSANFSEPEAACCQRSPVLARRGAPRPTGSTPQRPTDVATGDSDGSMGASVGEEDGLDRLSPFSLSMHSGSFGNAVIFRMISGSQFA